VTKWFSKLLKINNLGYRFDSPEIEGAIFTGLRPLSDRDRIYIWENKYEFWKQHSRT